MNFTNGFVLAALSWMDWTLVAAYMLAVLGIGFAVSIGKKNDDPNEAFLGGRNIPTWAAGLSFLATTLSAATFIGGPAEAYGGNLGYLVLQISTIGGGLIAALWLIPLCHKASGATVYHVIGQHAGLTAQRSLSVSFLAGRLLASGARLMIVGTAMAAILFPEHTSLVHILFAILLCGAVGTAYTAFGGIRAIIWTDTLQLLVLSIAVGGAVLLIHNQLDGGLNAALQQAGAAGKLTWLDTSFSWQKPYSLWSALAWTVFAVAAFGCDQDMAQRLLSCKSPAQATRALLGGIGIGLPVTTLFLLLGILLWAFYQAQPEQPQAAFAFSDFISHHMSTPLRGLAVAGLTAAAMSSFDSASGAMASCLSQDLGVRTRPWLLTLTTGTSLTLAAAGLGIIKTAMPETSLLGFALGVMTYAYAGMLGVFICCLVFKRGNTTSIIAAQITGAVTIALFNFGPMLLHSLNISGAHAWPKIAFTWPMLIATLISLAICLAGKPARQVIRI